MNGNNHFPFEQNNPTCELLSTLPVGKKNTYVLTTCTDNENNKLAVALSNYVIKVYDVNNSLLSEYVHNKEVTGVKFSSTDPSLLFSSSLDGKIIVWDSRCKDAAQTFIENSEGSLKPLSCFDYNSNEELLCAGTEMIREDTFLVFWDRRTSNCLGGYWNSHTYDITQVHFHPSMKSCMASASVDGLINIFDVSKQSEDDALMHTLNVGSAVNKFSWRYSDFLSCSTSIEEYQFWSTTEASPTLSMSREDLSSRCEHKLVYIIDCLQIANTWYLAAGTDEGMIHLWYSDKKCVKPMGCILKGHSDVVRTICCNSKGDVIYTGGEDGYVCQWKVLSNTL